MSLLALLTGTGLAVRARPRAASYAVETASDWPAAAAGWAGAATPFQACAWLDAWYGTFQDRPGLTPLIVTARDAASGALAMRLPLVLHRQGGRRTIAFADLELSDYNAPVLGPAAPRTREDAAALWRAVRSSLPPARVLRLTKMPVTLGARPNPLALLPGALPCAVNGNVVSTGEDWDAWRYGLEKTVRKELERSWRVFSRESGTAFTIVTDLSAAHRILDAMERQQETRMRAKGADYALDDPELARFYRGLIDRALPSGLAVVSALTAGEEVVASLLGLRDRASYVMIRISHAGGRWTNCSPGRLIIERTMAALHAQGCRAFDFSIGNYDYKRRFGVAPIPLVDLTESLGWNGLPRSLRASAAGNLRRHPELDQRFRAMLARLRPPRA